MKNFNIGIMGCLINCTNLGCVALSYTLIQELEKIASRNDIAFTYTVFDENYLDNSISLMSEKLKVDKSRIKRGVVGMPQMYNIKSVIRALTKQAIPNIQMINDIKKCDLVIDMTGGDSFSDIYGKERFYRLTTIKRIVERLNVPLILGPQTYGPFTDTKVLNYAKKVLLNAKTIIARDDDSAQYVESIIGAPVSSTIDIAFGLQYTEKSLDSDGKIKIGINPSGLLGARKNENTTLNSQINVDYERYIREIVDCLSKNDCFQIYLISHVGKEAIECFPNIKNVVYCEPFKDPMEAKSFISSMDLFLGSRMHATIGAFSAGVPMIPIAYSKKFKGLYHSLGYDFLIDLQVMSTEEAITKTLYYVEEIEKLNTALVNSKELVNQRYNKLLQVLECALLFYLKNE